MKYTIFWATCFIVRSFLETGHLKSCPVVMSFVSSGYQHRAVTRHRGGYSGRGGIDPDSHRSSELSFMARNSSSGVSLTSPEAKNWILSSPLFKAVILEMRPAEAKEIRNAVFLSCTFTSLHSTPISLAASNTLGRDQFIGLGRGFGRSFAQDLEIFAKGSWFQRILNPHLMGTVRADFRVLMVVAAKPLSCKWRKKETQESMSIVFGCCFTIYLTHFFHLDCYCLFVLTIL